MEPKERRVVCPGCGKPFRATPSIGLLGFQKFHCPKCGKKVIYPLLRRRYYWFTLGIFALVALLLFAGYSSGEWGLALLTVANQGVIYVVERISYILFPLAAWAILRLLGMHYPWALPAARTLLWYTGRVALVIGVLVIVVAGVSRLVWMGVIMEPLLTALFLGAVSSAILIRDKMIRKQLKHA